MHAGIERDRIPVLKLLVNAAPAPSTPDRGARHIDRMLVLMPLLVPMLLPGGAHRQGRERSFPGRMGRAHALLAAGEVLPGQICRDAEQLDA
jgi:hypothetical protein